MTRRFCIPAAFMEEAKDLNLCPRKMMIILHIMYSRASGEKSLPVNELGKRTGLKAITCRRHLNEMQDWGYLVRPTHWNMPINLNPFYRLLHGEKATLDSVGDQHPATPGGKHQQAVKAEPSTVTIAEKLDKKRSKRAIEKTYPSLKQHRVTSAGSLQDAVAACLNLKGSISEAASPEDEPVQEPREALPGDIEQVYYRAYKRAFGELSERLGAREQRQVHALVSDFGLSTVARALNRILSQWPVWAAHLECEGYPTFSLFWERKADIFPLIEANLLPNVNEFTQDMELAKIL